MRFGEAVNDPLQQAKKTLRATVLARRDAMLPAARTAASREILAKVCALPQYRDAKYVLTYMGFGSEIETQAFFLRIIADGKTAVLPRVDQATQSLILHSARHLSELLAGKWGIREPHPDAPTVSMSAIDFILMPGVAFDRSGNRLGYGRGYYDKAVLAANPALVRVTACFACQIVDQVPAGPLDQKVNIIITENEIIAIAHDR